MDSQKLIEDLTHDLRPVKRLLSPSKRTFVWITLQLFLVWGLMMWRKEFIISSSALVIFEAVILLAIGAIAGLISYRDVIPGIRNKNLKVVLIFLTFLFISSLALRAISGLNPISFNATRSWCEFEMIGLSLIPLSHLFALLRSGVYRENKKTLYLATLASVAIPAFFMHFVCGNHPLHALLFHVLPLSLAVGIIGYSLHYLYQAHTNKEVWPQS